MILRTTVPTGDTDTPPSGMRSLSRWGRQHALFGVLLAAGLVLRVITWFAYQPALLYTDSYRYLGNIDGEQLNGTDPAGYSVFLAGLLHVPDLAVVPAVQHVLGLGMAVGVYAVLVRRGMRRWAAALAAAPILLDAYVLQIEQLVMSDTLFITLIVVALVALAWKPRPGVVATVVAGAALGLAFTVRTVGWPLIVVALIFVLVAGAGLRPRLRATGALLVAFVLPIAAYAVWTSSAYGEYGFGTSHGRILYARAATIADCRHLDLPGHELPLCPSEPVKQRPGVDVFMWGPDSPATDYQAPPGMSRDTVMGNFAMRVFRAQPVDFADAVFTDFLRGFVPIKVDMPNQVPVERWQFQTAYPQTGTQDGTPAQVVARFGGHDAAVNPDLASFLRGYQLNVGYLPGTVVGLCLLAGLLAGVGVGRARRSGLRLVCLLFSAAGGVVLLTASLFEFSWRYQLPGIVILPAAGVLAITAMVRRPPPDDGNDEVKKAGGDGSCG